jgi:eukaryotic-like serine/threonine-protein kinase
MKTTVPYHAMPPGDDKPGNQALVARYEEIAWAQEISWDADYRKDRLLGAGSQGAVYLAHRLGANGFIRPVALKAFSPETYRDDQEYLDDMAQVGQICSRVALIQCDNVVDIHDFVEWHGVRLMEMEWLDGYDLRAVLHQQMLDLTRDKVTPDRWLHINNVILTALRASQRSTTRGSFTATSNRPTSC